MIVVTGLRNGTSWMMQTLEMLGFPVIGYKFHDDFSHKELNPYGYYSLPMKETVFGLKTYYKGKVVKLGGAELYRTNSDWVKKIIVCERNEKDTIKSIIKLLKADFSIAGIESTHKNAKTVYNLNKYFQELALEEFDNPFIRISFEEMGNNYNNVCEKLCKFLVLEGKLCQ